MKAFLKNYRQSPRKVRLVADLIKGKTVKNAYVLLRHTPKRATDQIKKLLDSAVANASQGKDLKKEDLYIKSVRVDEGRTMQRYRPVSRGSAHPIKKRASHISLVLEQRAQTKDVRGKAQNEDKAVVKK